MSNMVAVAVIPKCDMCGRKAYADAQLPGGPWANVCHTHFVKYGCALGLGKGQEYVVGNPDFQARVDDAEDSVSQTLGKSGAAELRALYGDDSDGFLADMEDFGLA